MDIHVVECGGPVAARGAEVARLTSSARRYAPSSHSNSFHIPYSIPVHLRLASARCALADVRWSQLPVRPPYPPAASSHHRLSRHAVTYHHFIPFHSTSLCHSIPCRPISRRMVRLARKHGTLVDDRLRHNRVLRGRRVLYGSLLSVHDAHAVSNRADRI